MFPHPSHLGIKKKCVQCSKQRRRFFQLSHVLLVTNYILPRENTCSHVCLCHLTVSAASWALHHRFLTRLLTQGPRAVEAPSAHHRAWHIVGPQQMAT